MKKIVFALCFFWILNTNSQDKIPFQNSQSIIEEAVKASNNGDYAKCIELLKSIHKNDSMYIPALKDQSYYLLQQEKYDDAIATADQGIASKTSMSKSTFYINKSVALIALKRYEDAINLIEEGLKKFPASPLLLYNKGVCLSEMGKIEESAKAFEQTIRYRPFYPSAHLKLGNIAYQQGLFAQALMCFNTYLLISPDTDSSFEILKSLNNLVKTKFPQKNNSISLSEDDNNYKGIDEILNSHIALNDRYTIENELKLSVIKQNHALLAEIQNLPKTDDFWGEYYIPLFAWIKEENHFDNFAYTICYTIKNKEYQEVIQKNVKEIKEFTQLFNRKWTSLIRLTKVKEDGQIKTLYSNYNNQDRMKSQGFVANNKAVGQWNYFYDSGERILEGKFDDDENRHGRWTWYHKNGNVKEIADYDHGKIQNKNLIYYPNGELSIDAEVKDGQLNGKYLYYQQGGALSQKKYFKEGTLDGKYLSYFAAGESMLEYDVDYKNDSIMGTMLEYHSNGEVFKKSMYQNGILQREEEYFEDGKFSLEQNYVNGELNGPYKEYYHNQQVGREGQHKDGAAEGVWKTYYRDGRLESEFGYSKGEINGQYKHYHADGKLYYDMTYRRGELIAYTYYDKDGKVLSEGKKKGGEFNYRGLNPNGSVLSEGLYDVSGGKEGLWKFYSPNGVLIEQGNYLANEPYGEHPNFYDNGEIKVEQRFEQGTISGYYAEYHQNRKISFQGWYLDGQQHGEWRSYFKDGTVSAIYYYHKGELNGCSQYFGVEGKIDTETCHEFGKKVKETVFDSAGTPYVIFDLYDTKEKEVTSYQYANGQTQATISYLNKVKHGPFKKYGLTGNVLIEGKHRNGELSGNVKYYHENGQLKYDYNYINGGLDGVQLEYFDNGVLYQKDEYRSGTIINKQVSYHDNGTMATEKTLLGGTLHGEFKLYDINGSLQIIRYYENGNLVGYSYEGKDGKILPMIPLKNASGKAVSYYKNGQVSREMEFFNNSLVNNYKAYYDDGTLENEIQFVEGNYNGIFLEYYPNGKLKNEKNYLYGDLHGLQKSYYENGQLKSSQNYLNNIMSGAGKHFNESGKLIKEVNYHNGSMNALKEY